MARTWLCLVVFMVGGVINVRAQSGSPPDRAAVTAGVNNPKMETTDDWNRRLQQLVRSALANAQNAPSAADYRIGPEDQILINVLDAPDLSSAYRVSADGNISMPLLGPIRAAGLTPRQLELVLQALLRRTYMKDPQVTVTVTEIQSHSVSVVGAVKQPGVFQIRGTKTLLEMLSLAQGLAPDAGNEVLVMRGADADFDPGSPLNSTTQNGVKALAPGNVQSRTVSASSDDIEDNRAIVISLKRLLDSGDPKYNIPIYPGDIVKVKAAGIVYVVGDVKQPGGFPVKDNGHITVLQAIALGQGMASTAAKSRARIIRVAENGKQIEIPIHLKKILAGKAPDPVLQPKDILFIPKSGSKSAGLAAIDTFSKMLIWRGIP